MIDIGEVETLAKTVWGEARGEELVGMVAVAWAVKNRTLRKPWPDSYLEVCLQPWQFSVWNHRDPTFPILVKGPEDSDAYQVATWVALGVVLGIIDDPTGGADHYHNKDVMPHWAINMQQTVEIGDHVFYNSE